jgi:hypothetical protein
MNDLVINNVVVVPVLWRNKQQAVSQQLRGLEVSGWDSDLATLFNWHKVKA